MLDAKLGVLILLLLPLAGCAAQEPHDEERLLFLAVVPADPESNRTLDWRQVPAAPGRELVGAALASAAGQRFHSNMTEIDEHEAEQVRGLLSAAWAARFGPPAPYPFPILYDGYQYFVGIDSIA